MPQVRFLYIKATPINWQPFYDEISKTFDNEVKPDIVGWFDKITAKWANKPDLESIKTTTQTEISVRVYPTGKNADIWRWVTKGNPKPYPIPKIGNTKAKMLRFKTGYKPFTTPQGGYKGPGKATGKTVFRKRVIHPVVPGRHFEKHIARWYYPRYRRVMKNAVARGLRKAQTR